MKKPQEIHIAWFVVFAQFILFGWVITEKIKTSESNDHLFDMVIEKQKTIDSLEDVQNKVVGDVKKILNK